MSDRQYFSARRRGAKGRFFLPELQELFFAVYKKAEAQMLLAEALGYRLSGWRHIGTLGRDPGIEVRLAFRKGHLWPVTRDSVKRYSRDDVFDMVEFLYDHASEPIYSHDTIFHASTPNIVGFDPAQGRHKFREMINDVLRDYKAGWQLMLQGEVVRLPDGGFEALLEEELPEYDPENVEQRVQTAIRKFRARGSTDTDKLDAIRELAAELRGRGALACEVEHELHQIVLECEMESLLCVREAAPHPRRPVSGQGYRGAASSMLQRGETDLLRTGGPVMLGPGGVGAGAGVLFEPVLEVAEHAPDLAAEPGGLLGAGEQV